MGILDPFLQISRDLDFVGPVAVAPVGLLVEHVDDPAEIRFLAQRQFQRQDPFPDLGPEIVQDIVVISVFPIHFVHEDQPGQTCFFRQLPALFRPDLDPAGGADHDQHAVHRPEGPFHFRHEIRKPRGIDEVDLHIPPFHRCQGGADRNPSFDFFRFKVRSGLAVFHLAHPADGPAAVEQSFRQGSGACASMTYDCHVSDFITCILFHCTAPFVPYGAGGTAAETGSSTSLMVLFFGERQPFSCFLQKTFEILPKEKGMCNDRYTFLLQLFLRPDVSGTGCTAAFRRPGAPEAPGWPAGPYAGGNGRCRGPPPLPGPWRAVSR